MLFYELHSQLTANLKNLNFAGLLRDFSTMDSINNLIIFFKNQQKEYLIQCMVEEKLIKLIDEIPDLISFAT